MAFSSDIVLADNAAANKTFTTVKVEPNGVTRLDTSSTDLSVPRTMTVKHQVVGNDKTPGGASDRHLISFIHQERDGSGVVLAAVCNVTLTVPRNSVVTRAEVDHLIAFAKNFLVTANVDKLLRNES